MAERLGPRPEFVDFGLNAIAKFDERIVSRLTVRGIDLRRFTGIHHTLLESPGELVERVELLLGLGSDGRSSRPQLPGQREGGRVSAEGGTRTHTTI